MKDIDKIKFENIAKERVNKCSTKAQLLYFYIESEKKLSNSLYAQGAEAISEGIANSIKNIEKEETSNVNSKY